jgi:DNA repair protein RAD50
VKAQIRLKFNNINKQTMIVTRSLQLVQKKMKTEMKTLESLLMTKDPTTGEVDLGDLSFFLI